jgi:hypothetical protein
MGLGELPRRQWAATMTSIVNFRDLTLEPSGWQRATGGTTPAADEPAGSGVGARSRLLFRRLALWRRAPMPRLERLYWHTLKPLFAAFLIAWYTPRYAASVRRRFGIPVLRQLREQCRLGFRDWVNPRNYYFHELYRRRGAADCSDFVMRHEIKEGLLKSLHKLMPKVHGERVNLGHKLAFAEVCARHGLPTPAILGVAAHGRIVWCDPTAQSRGVPGGDLPDCDLPDCDLFVKPEHGRGAVGAQGYRRRPAQGHAGGCYGIGDYASISQEALLQGLAWRSRIRPHIIQPLLRNHPDLADLADHALVTLRLITCMDEAGHPVVTHAMLRSVTKLEPDWATAEEYAAPIDLATGQLGVMCGDSVFGPQHRYDFHPVTCARVTGRIVPLWPEVHDLAIRAHRVFADRLLLGFDIAVTPEGAVLIEANSYPDTEFLQRVHGEGIGRSPLGPLLARHLDRLEALGGRFRS